MQAGDAGICTQGEVEGEVDGAADESGGAIDVRQIVGLSVHSKMGGRCSWGEWKFIHNGSGA